MGRNRIERSEGLLHLLLLGISEPRNIQLANIFYRLHLIEAYGTGVPKIMDHYLEHDKKPTIEISDNAFKIMLPNMNGQISKPEHPGVVLTQDEQMILNLLRNRENPVRAEIESETGFSQAKSIRMINQLINKGELVKIGKGKLTHYRLAN
ncbi:MAG: ATP-binding protein [Eubacteriales bacterium]|nr:ATP-binding protein [Eubacteriales bacterium]